MLKYNQEAEDNPLGLYPAYQLYENEIYGRLIDHLGMSKVYILSAGWGLIAAHFLTPYYDITFSRSAEDYKRRRKKDHSPTPLADHPRGRVLCTHQGKFVVMPVLACSAWQSTTSAYPRGACPQSVQCRNRSHL